MKDTLFAEHSIFTAISRRTFQKFSLNAPCHTPCALPTNGVRLLAPAKNKRLLKGQQSTFTVMCRLSFERLCWNFTIIVMGSVYKHCDFGCNGPIIRGGLHGKQINFTAIYRLPFERNFLKPHIFHSNCIA